MWPFKKKQDDDDFPLLTMRNKFDIDMHTVLEIEKESFDYPWNKGEFVDVLRGGGCINIERQQGEVVGYLCFSPARYGAELKSVAVRSSLRRRGIGTKLMTGMKNNVQLGDRIMACVSDRNTTAHVFLRSCGMKAISIREKHYGNGDDAYVFSWRSL